MSAKAILRKEDAKRFAEVAKSEGVSVRVIKGDLAIEFSPFIDPSKHKEKEDDNKPPEDMAL